MTNAPGPARRDWLLLVTSLVFVALGLLMLRDDPREALAPLTFFGLCALVFAYNIARKLRRRRFTATAVAVAGGVKLHASNSRVFVLAILVAVPGIAIFLSPHPPLIIQLCGAVMVAAGVLLVAMVLSGRVARRFLRFDPLGLTLGENGFEFVVPWNDLQGIVEFELHNNAMVGFDVRDVRNLLVTPETARPRLRKWLDRNAAYSGRQVVIMPLHFGASAEALAGALRNYAENPHARAQLVPRPALPQA